VNYLADVLGYDITLEGKDHTTGCELRGIVASILFEEDSGVFIQATHLS
jgi:hypothetical protein